MKVEMHEILKSIDDSIEGLTKRMNEGYGNNVYEDMVRGMKTVRNRLAHEYPEFG